MGSKGQNDGNITADVHELRPAPMRQERHRKICDASQKSSEAVGGALPTTGWVTRILYFVRGHGDR